MHSYSYVIYRCKGTKKFWIMQIKSKILDIIGKSQLFPQGIVAEFGFALGIADENSIRI